MALFAIAEFADQTIAYISKYKLNDDNTYTLEATTRHPEAMLLDSAQDASEIASVLSISQALYLKDKFPEMDEKAIRGFATKWIEQVDDEAEFRSREDTW